MLEKIIMPQLGESVTEGTITAWLVKKGDAVKKYEPIVEVQTDKVNAEVPSSLSGIINEIVVAEGETVGVGEVICYIETTTDNQERASWNREKITEPNETIQGDQGSMKKRFSPAVLVLSQEHDIDLSTIKGTGTGGRITRKDVEKAIAEGEEYKTENIEPKKESISVRPQGEAVGDVKIPMSGIRKTIATNMLRSTKEIPHAWMMVEADVTGLVDLRNKIKDEFVAREGYPITYFAFFVKAVAQALKEYPMINAMWNGDHIVQKKEINISIAVGTETELYVPVIKRADEKSIKGIAREINELAGKVKSKKISAEEMGGGTFTVNNTGAFGSIQSKGIINYPQAAILQVESICKKPVVIGDGIAIRSMVNLCLSLDHRVLDGLICGKFLARVKKLVEDISWEKTTIY